MADKTHSEFASHLLEVLEEMTRLKGAENQLTSSQASPKKLRVITSGGGANKFFNLKTGAFCERVFITESTVHIATMK